MNSSGLEPAYEATRTWALHPVSHPPPGWAQILRGAMISWMRERPALMGSASLAHEPARLSSSPLLMLVAAMIAEGCQ
jgi:hypothetical protein